MNKRKNVFVGFAVSVVLLMLVASGMAMPIQEKVVSDSLVSEPVEDGGCSLCAEDLSIDTAAIVEGLETIKQNDLLTPEMSAQIDQAISIALNPAGWPYQTCWAIYFILWWSSQVYYTAFFIENGYYPDVDEMPYWMLALFDDFYANCQEWYPPPSSTVTIYQSTSVQQQPGRTI